jgi:hypothetical protein
MNTSDDWLQRISEVAQVPVADVTTILEEEQIPRKRMLPARHRLRVNAVHFAGVKNIRAQDRDGRVHQPYSFTHRFSTDVSAFMTRHRNLAGKSTVLDVILWAVRGMTGMADDVRDWMRQAVVEMSIDDVRFVVAWTIAGSMPAGRITQIDRAINIDWDNVDTDAFEHMHAQFEGHPGPGTTISPAITGIIDQGLLVGSFTGDEEFKIAIAELVGSRLGFESAEVFRKNPRASDDLDGKVVTHGWPNWSQGLFISNNKIKATIGEEPVTSGLLLQMYLGTAWGPAATAAKARQAAREAEIATLRRRQTAEDDKRSEILKDLYAERDELLTQMAKVGEEDDYTKYERAVADVKITSAVVVERERDLTAITSARIGLRQQLDDARSDETAAHEAAITKRFWHSLKPSCCPRCDAVVDETRWAREQVGQCSLCDSDLGTTETTTTVVIEAPEPSEASDDDHDELQLARERVIALEAELESADRELADSSERRDNAVVAQQTAIDAARAIPVDPGGRRNLEQRIAVLNGRIQERKQIAVPSAALDRQQRIIAVLKAAASEAKNRSDTERTALLERVSADITELGQSLGFIELDRADFQGNTHLPVTRGGKPNVAFGKLTEGEKLRLKIAVIIALLRAGHEAGIGRHPGLLLIDSIGREEMNVTDVRQLLEELVRVATQTGLQVITTSAQGDSLADALPAGAVRMSREDDDYMW